jgi:N utilization substance protein B
MVSRRSVRVKVMQLLYAKNRDKALSEKKVLNAYDDSIENSFELYLLTLFIFLQTTRIAVIDKKKRDSKHLPSDEDKVFSDKLYSNDLIQSIIKNQKLEAKFNKLRFPSLIDEDLFKRLYREFVKTDAYKEYVISVSSDAAHREILLELFRSMRKDEYFTEVLDDHYPNWSDDKSLAIGAIKKTIKQTPNIHDDFYEAYTPDAETAEEFGRQLLKETLGNEATLLKYIEPILNNWDLDRLAIIDMILIQMALTEFIYFPTIPTKVTLNEYVEISKQYSTAKSKDFVNGILDKLMKSLDEEGMIKKEGRGLVS